MIRYLKSLTALDGALGGKVRVEGRLFKVSPRIQSFSTKIIIYKQFKIQIPGPLLRPLPVGHPLRAGEPQQVHGHGQPRIRRHLELVRGLLRQHGGHRLRLLGVAAQVGPGERLPEGLGVGVQPQSLVFLAYLFSYLCFPQIPPHQKNREMLFIKGCAILVRRRYMKKVDIFPQIKQDSPDRSTCPGFFYFRSLYTNKCIIVPTLLPLFFSLRHHVGGIGFLSEPDKLLLRAIFLISRLAHLAFPLEF